jgi:hypothetical protein
VPNIERRRKILIKWNLRLRQLLRLALPDLLSGRISLLGAQLITSGALSKIWNFAIL